MTPPHNILAMPADPNDREKHRRAGELIALTRDPYAVADKARHVVVARAIQQMNQPESRAEEMMNAVFTGVAIFGAIAALFFVAHQVSVWAQ